MLEHKMGGGWSMRTFLVAAAGFPTLLFTAALVVVVVFWLLVAVGAAASDTFDADIDLGVWGMGGVPVAVALSLLTAFAWHVSLGATVLLDPLVPAGAVRVLTRLVVLLGALCVAWWLTRWCVRHLRRRSPDERGPSRPGLVGPVGAIRTVRMDDVPRRAERAARDGSRASAQVHQADTGLEPRGHAA